MNMSNRFNLKINIPHEEDNKYHNEKIKNAMMAEELYWKKNQSEYYKYLNNELQQDIMDLPTPLTPSMPKKDRVSENIPIKNNTEYYITCFKPLMLILLLQYSIFICFIILTFKPIINIL